MSANDSGRPRCVVGSLLRGATLSLAVLTCSRAATAAILYVDQSATGANNGTSWANAYRTLQSALRAASNGDEIWVAAGTYRPDDGPLQTLGDRSATFVLKPGVSIYGGFAGNELRFLQRDIEQNKSILSGDLNADDSSGNYNDNSQHIMTADGLGPSEVHVNGLVFQGGNADSLGVGASMGKGGALFVNASNGIRVRSCEFTDNHASSYGGGIYTTARLRLHLCEFSKNTAFFGGGAAAFSEASGHIIERCNFSENYAQVSGGAVALLDTGITIRSCHVLNNRALAGGGIGSEASVVRVANSLFTGNEGGALYLIEFGSLFAVNNTIVHNHGLISSGGIESNMTATLLNNILWGNTSDKYGAGVLAQFQYITALAFYGLSVSYNCIQAFAYFDQAGQGNHSRDPRFLDAANGDYRLRGKSPCADAGSSSVLSSFNVDGDLDRLPRFVDDLLVPDTGIGGSPIVDMGAYEVQSLLKFDCNGNRSLDAEDIADGTSLDVNGNGVPDECE